MFRLSQLTSLAFALAGITLLSGCGSSASATTPSANPQAAALAFAQCMRQHGVNVPDPQTNGGGGQFSIKFDASTGNSSQLQAANQACQQYLPKLGGTGSTPNPQMQADALKFAQCMRQHGVTNFPDPQTGSGGGIMLGGPNGAAPGFDPSSQQFQQAQKACQSLLGGLKGGPGLQISGGSGSGAAGAGGEVTIANGQ